MGECMGLGKTRSYLGHNNYNYDAINLASSECNSYICSQTLLVVLPYLLLTFLHADNSCDTLLFVNMVPTFELQPDREAKGYSCGTARRQEQ